jgi:hypothetical protein
MIQWIKALFSATNVKVNTKTIKPGGLRKPKTIEKV